MRCPECHQWVLFTCQIVTPLLSFCCFTEPSNLSTRTWGFCMLARSVRGPGGFIPLGKCLPLGPDWSMKISANFIHFYRGRFIRHLLWNPRKGCIGQLFQNRGSTFQKGKSTHKFTVLVEHLEWMAWLADITPTTKEGLQWSGPRASPQLSVPLCAYAILVDK